MKFDLFISTPPPLGTDLPKNLKPWVEEIRYSHKIFTGFSKEDARDIVFWGLQNQANLYLIPTAYRDCGVDLETARAIAVQEHEKLARQGFNLGPIDSGEDEFTMWWVFHAPLLDRESYPGQITFGIDKLDGHLRSNEEFKTILKLSSRSSFEK